LHRRERKLAVFLKIMILKIMILKIMILKIMILKRDFYQSLFSS